MDLVVLARRTISLLLASTALLAACGSTSSSEAALPSPADVGTGWREWTGSPYMSTFAGGGVEEEPLPDNCGGHTITTVPMGTTGSLTTDEASSFEFSVLMDEEAELASFYEYSVSRFACVEVPQDGNSYVVVQAPNIIGAIEVFAAQVDKNGVRSGELLMVLHEEGIVMARYLMRSSELSDVDRPDLRSLVATTVVDWG